MTNLEENIQVIRYLAGVNPDEFKDVKVVNGYLECNGKSLPINMINIKQIVDSNELLSKEIYTMKADALFDILQVNERVLSSFRQTDNLKIINQNTQLIDQLKSKNELLKDVTVINKEHDFIHEQYFNVVDDMGNVHVFKNDRNLDISNIINEFLMSNDKNLNHFINLINRFLPEITMNLSINIENNSFVSEDFKNKFENVQKEYEGKNNVHVYGNEEEGIITVVDELNSKNNKVITSRRDENNNLITEEMTRDETEEKIEDSDVQSLNENEMQDNVSQDSEKMEQEVNKEEEKVKLVSFEKFIELNNMSFNHTEEQKRQLELWEQTLGDMYIYEEYLSTEVLEYLKRYQLYIIGLEPYKEEGLLNNNQLAAINKYYELTNPNVKKEKLENMSEERKNDISRKLELPTENNEGKISIILILSIIFGSCISIVYMISLLFK